MSFMTPAPIAPSQLEATLFPQTSRYYGLRIRKHTLADGKQVSYVDRRFVPQPEQFELLQEHSVAEGDRPDNLAATYLGDPEQFWRLADANYDLNPFDLVTTVGRRLRITLPEGIPAMPTIE
jgi:hypothetical protein